MNRLKSSASCRLCRFWLEGDWTRADDAGRKSLQRQMDNGMCDECQRERLDAAVEFIRARDQARLDGWADEHGWLPQTGGVKLAHRRVADATKRCVRLRMWSAEQQTEIPERFREE